MAGVDWPTIAPALLHRAHRRYTVILSHRSTIMDSRIATKAVLEESTSTTMDDFEDLNDLEWESVKDRFIALLPKYGSLWNTMDTPQRQRQRHASTSSSACPCCPPIQTFVPKECIKSDVENEEHVDERLQRQGEDSYDEPKALPTESNADTSDDDEEEEDVDSKEDESVSSGEATVIRFEVSFSPVAAAARTSVQLRPDDGTDSRGGLEESLQPAFNSDISQDAENDVDLDHGEDMLSPVYMATLTDSPSSTLPSDIDITQPSADTPNQLEDSSVEESPSMNKTTTSSSSKAKPLVIELLDSSSSSSSSDDDNWMMQAKSQSKCKSPRFQDNFPSDEDKPFKPRTKKRMAVLESSSDDDERSVQGEPKLPEVMAELIAATELITIESSDDELPDEMESGDKDDIGELAVGATNKVPARHPSKAAFRRNRESIAQAMLARFDKIAFDSQLRSSVTLLWSAKLRTTAGLTRLRHGLHHLCRTATIELSSKILDTEVRLQSTLVHEMCHAAAWIVDSSTKPPHGKIFQKWAKIAMAKIPNVVVTTVHDYRIEYKYAWACQSSTCGAIIKRHSRSVDPNIHVCGRCQSRLVEVAITNGTADPTQPRIKAAPSAYNAFLARNSKAIRQQLQEQNQENGMEVSQTMVLRECARRWNEMKRSADK